MIRFRKDTKSDELLKVLLPIRFLRPMLVYSLGSMVALKAIPMLTLVVEGSLYREICCGTMPALPMIDQWPPRRCS